MPRPPTGCAGLCAVGPRPFPAPAITTLCSCPHPVCLPVGDTPSLAPSHPVFPGASTPVQAAGRGAVPPDLGRGYSLASSPLLCPALSTLSDLSSAALSLGRSPSALPGPCLLYQGPGSPLPLQGGAHRDSVRCPVLPDAGGRPSAGPDQPLLLRRGTELFAG